MTTSSDDLSHDFGRLLLRHEGRIYGLIRLLVPNRADAEDVFQNTASVLWRKFDHFKPGSDFVAWALTIARYQAKDYLKKQGRDRLRFSQPLIDALAEEATSPSSPANGVGTALEGCLTKLSDRDREIIRYRYVGGSPVPKIATMLNRPPTTIYNALKRIRRALAACVERTLAQEEHAL